MEVNHKLGMNHQIQKASQADYLDVIAIWEASVRATHHFITEEDIKRYKPMILNEYLDQVQLYILKEDKNNIVGFVGTADQKMEMLFIHPNYFGKGIGRTLTEFAISELQVTEVDVNEQNEGAVGFYLHMGFQIKSRSELDGQGNPFPILHLSWQTAGNHL